MWKNTKLFEFYWLVWKFCIILYIWRSEYGYFQHHHHIEHSISSSWIANTPYMWPQSFKCFRHDRPRRRRLVEQATKPESQSLYCRQIRMTGWDCFSRAQIWSVWYHWTGNWMPDMILDSENYNYDLHSVHSYHEYEANPRIIKNKSHSFRTIS